jgi:HEAT repeat protein
MATFNSKKKKRWVTAEEVVAELQQDPEYLKRIQEKEQRRTERVKKSNLASQPILRELQDAGYCIESLGELGSIGTYKSAVPILLKWLPLVQDRGIKRSIVSALSVPWAKLAAIAPLLSAFREAPADDPGTKWAIGNALEVVADDSAFVEISELVCNKQHGSSREMLAVALGNMRNPVAVDLLIDLLNDDDLTGHALEGLRKLKTKKARPYVEPFLTHPKAWIRKEARRTLAKLIK